MGDSPDSTVLLTDKFLFGSYIVSNGVLPDRRFSFAGLSDACLVIPVEPGESNKVFNFIAENDSEATVVNLEATLGFPDNWKCAPDPKWQRLKGGGLIIPGLWKLDVTNMQFWATQTPWTMFPWDKINFPPMGESTVAPYEGWGSHAGFVQVGLRAAGLSEVLMANIIFMENPPWGSKPVVVRGTFTKSGKLQISPPDLRHSLEDWTFPTVEFP